MPYCYNCGEFIYLSPTDGSMGKWMLYDFETRKLHICNKKEEKEAIEESKKEE